MASIRIFLLPALAATALLGTAAPAFARAPAASDQASLEWILQKLKKDREAEKVAKPVSSDPLQAYEKGEAPIEEWKSLTDRIRNKRLTFAERERATSAILARFKAEEEARKLDPKAVETEKKRICSECLDLMVQDDENSRNHIRRLTQQLLPNIGVNWSVGDSPAKRQKAFRELQKKLRT